MCDENPIWITFALISTAIAGAMAVALAAIALNTTWWTSWASPALLAAAAATAGTAAGLVFAVQRAMNTYFACMNGGGTTSHCQKERDDADRLLVAIGVAVGTAATIALYNLVVSFIPGAGQIPMWTFYIALATQLGLLPAAGARLRALIDCLKKSRLGTKTTPLPSATGRLDYDVFTCPLSRSSCGDADLQRAGRSPTPVFSVSPSFAVLVGAAGQLAVNSVTAEAEDGFGTRAAVASSAISAPGAHAVFDPSYFVVRCRWAELSRQGIRLEPGSRTWKVRVEATFADGSTETLAVTVMVSN